MAGIKGNKKHANKTSFTDVSQIGNKSAEKWNLKEATLFFEKAYEIAKQEGVYHLTDIAVQLDTYQELFSYLIKKYPVFNTIKKKIDTLLVSRLNRGGLEGTLREGMTKFNLSANYNWKEKSEVKNETEHKFTGDPFKQIRENSEIDE
jgi:hypothetical protein